jgi:hypothetical protein
MLESAAARRKLSDAARQIRHHRAVVAIACAVWILALALHELPDGRVALRGLPQVPLLQICASRAFFRVRCPGCGLTRSLIHLAEGDYQASWRAHRLGGLLAVLIALQIPYRLLALRRPDHPLIAPRWQVVFGYALIALVLGNWLVDLGSGRLAAL